MGDLIIKPTTGSGNKLIIQTEDGTPIVTTSDSGAALSAAVTGTGGGGIDRGHRNILINGAMTVAQRGTSSTSSGYQTVDRFKSAFSTGGTWTQSQSTDSPAGFANSYKNECTVAETDMANMGYAMIQQKIEGQLLQHLDFGTASPKKFTLSFWVKSSLTGTHVCQLHAPYIATTEYNSHAYTVNVADTWEYKTITWTGDTGDVIPNDFESSIRIYWFLAAGNGYGSGTLTNDLWHTTTANRAAGQVNLAGTVGNTFYLTGAQLEIGETASPFEHRGYGDELIRCKRYYQHAGGSGSAGGMQRTWQVDGLYSNGAGAGLSVSFPLSPAMRATPSTSFSFTDLNNVTVMTVNTSSECVSPQAQASGSGRTAFNYGTNGYLNLDAEL